MERFLERTYPYWFSFISVILWIIFGRDVSKIVELNIIIYFILYIASLLMFVFLIMLILLLVSTKTKRFTKAIKLGKRLIESYLCEFFLSFIILVIVNTMLQYDYGLTIILSYIWIFCIITFIFCTIRAFWVLLTCYKINNIPDNFGIPPKTDAQIRFEENYKKKHNI